MIGVPQLHLLLLPLAPSTTRGPNVRDFRHRFPEQRLGNFGTVKVRGELDIILMSVTLKTEGKTREECTYSLLRLSRDSHIQKLAKCESTGNVVSSYSKATTTYHLKLIVAMIRHIQTHPSTRDFLW